MMNHIVPDFETDVDDFMIPELPNKSTMGGDEDIMELLWHNGQVVMQSQNQRSVGSKKAGTRASTAATASREIRSSVVEEETRPSGMFMQEDEMASWLHYPIDDNPLENYLYANDLIYPPPSSSAPIPAASTSLPPPPPPSVMIPSRPPVPPYRRTEAESVQPKNTNFVHFTRPNKSRSPELGPSVATKSTPAIQSATIVASNDTPMAKASESRASRVSDKPVAVSAGFNGGGWSTSGVGAAGASSAVREMETCELSVTSSPGSGGSGASASMEPLCQKPPPVSDDRKRKGIDADDNDCHSEDVEFEYADAKKQSHAGSTSTKRSRAAEIHNLSERRRRDRINEKMKALQELIPRCNKSDKASMLDEAIEYLKSLQMQVQMMSMGCNMVPMMYPGVQQYMPPMAMSMGMGMGMAGMGMGMDMGMNRAMVPYPAILPGSSLPNPAAAAAAAAAHLGQRFPVSGFNMSPVTVAGPTASQAANMPDPMMNPLILNSQNQPRVPNFADPFQQHLGLHQAQLPLPQNQGRVPPIATKPSSSKDTTNPDHHQTR